MPEDALGLLAGIEGLAAREAILARALIRHELAPPEQVLDAAHAAAAEPAGGGILDRLSAAGVLTGERARAVENALAKLIAGRRGAADATPSSAPGDGVTMEAPSIEDAGSGRKGPRMWKPRREREGGTGESVVVPHGEMRKRRERKDRDSIDKFLEKYVRSRLHQLVMEKLVRMRAGVADPKALARACGAKEKAVVRVLKDWKSNGLLMTVHMFPYYYDPPPKVEETARLFMKAWRDAEQHQRLLMKILDYEG